MGNRATVIFWNGETKVTKQEFSPAVYLHWNGGPESIYAFLEELDRREVRADQDYECARFIQLVGEFFTWSTQRDLTDPLYKESAYGLSLGVVNGPKSDKPRDLDKVRTDHGDNGLYLVCRAPGKESMRRFVEAPHLRETGKRLERWGDEPYDSISFNFFEFTPEEVEQEKQEAMDGEYSSKYGPDMRAFFLALEERAPAPTREEVA